MTVKELVEKLTNPEFYDKYKDRVVEKAVPTSENTYVGEEIKKVFFTGGDLAGRPVPETWEKVIFM